MKRHDLITLVLVVVFGLVGAWLFETFGAIGEYLSVFCAIPPAGYYLFHLYKAHPTGGGNS